MMNNRDETVHIICSCKLKTDKKYKEQILKEVAAAVCAMLNSNGGKVKLYYDSKCNPTKLLSSLTSRMLEQYMISIIGPRLTVSKIDIEEVKESLVIVVEKADSLITTSYNLYSPGQTQVVQLDPREPENVVKDIMDRRVVPEPVELGSHQKIFRRGQDSYLRESKMCQFKQLKADQSKRTTLADRMTGKSNKFSCYVSAYANYRGGHIYFGITVDKFVEGEVIVNEEDKQEIIKKVEKTINKMIWPEHIGQPKRGEHWDIFFESVLDENSTTIPSTFVIVIYIASCLGGVFTEEPECYEMVDGKVKRMTFIAWKKRKYDELLPSRGIISYVKRITWSSNRIREIYTSADQLLTQKLNNGESIQEICKSLKSTYPDLNEVRLLILSKKVMASYRSFCFRKAEGSIQEYKAVLVRTKDSAIFDAILAYISVALYRARGVREFPIEILISDALSKAEMIEPGLISAAIYLLVATIRGVLLSKDEQVSKIAGYIVTILATRALEHLQYVHDSPMARANMEQKAHITLALHHLGYNAYGMQTRKTIDSKDVDKAKSSLVKVDKLIFEGKSVNNYRNIHFNLAKAHLLYRQFEVNPDKSLLQNAFQFSKQAENLATECNFQEMLQYARACTAFCTESLIRFELKSRGQTRDNGTKET
ncbi:uncharacterized protein LOC114518985 [Dendronephthya gigantea]|uniref:uncharacterized protein LOC114518985 n=1 Tax=Dendronephthya gigantea TaxID=151771 RepID=UPI00106942F5|nr:uncharacterized protein LOC114518985 [Dendronephthya gigantea]